MLQKLKTIQFPASTGTMINMMPIIMGNPDSIPDFAKGYLPLIEQCGLTRGEVVYLTINESWVAEGKCQRRPGIHTDATFSLGWGGGSWGGSDKNNGKGIYVCSSDGRCRGWNLTIPAWTVDHHGSPRQEGLELLENTPSIKMDPNTLYWMTDRTPHESLPALQNGVRQFFRLVGSEVGAWYTQHSTPNPLGVKPNAPLITASKF